jgi:hypothetical protein
MGYSIGTRILDEFLARTMKETSAGGGGEGQVGACKGFMEIGEVIARLGFRIFLGIGCSFKANSVVSGNSNNGQQQQQPSFTLSLPQNPLSMFIELPSTLEGLCYSNILCGVLRGAFMAAGYKVEAVFVSDSLLGEEEGDVIEVRLVEGIRGGGVGDDFKDE